METPASERTYTNQDGISLDILPDVFLTLKEIRKKKEVLEISEEARKSLARATEDSSAAQQSDQDDDLRNGDTLDANEADPSLVARGRAVYSPPRRASFA